MFYFANELRDHAHYEEATGYYLQFLDSDGWVEDKINATINLADWFRKALRGFFSMPKVIFRAVDIAGAYKVGYTESTESDFQMSFGNHR